MLIITLNKSTNETNETNKYTFSSRSNFLTIKRYKYRDYTKSEMN